MKSLTLRTNGESHSWLYEGAFVLTSLYIPCVSENKIKDAYLRFNFVYFKWLIVLSNAPGEQKTWATFLYPNSVIYHGLKIRNIRTDWPVGGWLFSQWHPGHQRLYLDQPSCKNELPLLGMHWYGIISRTKLATNNNSEYIRMLDLFCKAVPWIKCNEQ